MYGLAVFHKPADYRVAIQVLNLQCFGALPKHHEDRTHVALHNEVFGANLQLLSPCLSCPQKRSAPIFWPYLVRSAYGWSPMAEINPDQYQSYGSSRVASYHTTADQALRGSSFLVETRSARNSGFLQLWRECLLSGRSPHRAHGSVRQRICCPYAMLRQFFQNLVGNRDLIALPPLPCAQADRHPVETVHGHSSLTSPSYLSFETQEPVPSIQDRRHTSWFKSVCCQRDA
jgi:hypothetical protein